jgi:hypothetical protein
VQANHIIPEKYSLPGRYRRLEHSRNGLHLNRPQISRTAGGLAPRILYLQDYFIRITFDKGIDLEQILGGDKLVPLPARRWPFRG